MPFYLNLYALVVFDFICGVSYLLKPPDPFAVYNGLSVALVVGACFHAIYASFCSQTLPVGISCTVTSGGTRGGPYAITPL